MCSSSGVSTRAMGVFVSINVEVRRGDGALTVAAGDAVRTWAGKGTRHQILQVPVRHTPYGDQNNPMNKRVSVESKMLTRGRDKARSRSLARLASSTLLATTASSYDVNMIKFSSRLTEGGLGLSRRMVGCFDRTVEDALIRACKSRET